MRELREGDFSWGAWLAFLRPHKDFVPLLLASMAEPTPETMLALGKSGDRRGLRPLLGLLKSADYQTAGFAARALGYLGAGEVEPELIEALSEDRPWVRCNAAGALANVGTRRALPALERLVNQKGDTGALDIRSAAMRAIVGIEKRDPKANPRPLPTGELRAIATLAGHEKDLWNVAFSPDGKTLASGSDDGTVRLWDRVSGKNTVIFRGHHPHMMHVAFTPDGKTLVSAGRGSEVGGIRLLDVATRKTTATLRGLSGTIESMVVSPNGKLIASSALGDNDEAVRLWDLASGKTVATLPGTSRPLAFGAGGTVLATTDLDAREQVKLWDLENRKVNITLRGHTDTVMAAAFSPDGRTVATVGDWTLRLWDIRTGKPVAVHRGDSRIFDVSFSPDGRLVAVGEVAGPVRVWDTVSGRFTVALRGRSPVAFSPDGRVLATGSEAGTTILLWDVPGEATPNK